ncbi:uncharacterized protein LOC119464535 isoform X3 [Dermacentor silvarum]|uniref:uncharacterized protein LOC119464535 isoform X3 n=1 Tax=Dermacentor silvarum TaxID=543639 RepID=UPI00210102EA|nr:uncharacterized protein LOC119464535 isoform X3 [Dermacentor silvarum]
MDSTRRERQRELARERQRRRRANPELREREVQAKRQRREAATAEDRERAAQAKRRWRQANPQFQEKATQAKRQQRQANPKLREQEAEQRRRRKQIPPTEGADGRFKREFLDREFGRSCKDREKEPASCCTHEILAKPVQTEASWLFNSSVVDVAVETSRSADVCKSTQTSLVVVKVHRWTETTDLIESQEGDTDAQESPAPHVCGMPMLTNMDQSPGVAALYSHQVDVCDDTFMDCSGGPAAAQTLYDGSCIVRWCTNTSPGRLFRVPKDNRMEAFLKYAERPHLLGLSKEIVHHYRICSAHFTESDYMDPAKTKLKWLAVPSIKAPEESKALQVCGMPRLTNMDQSPGVAALYSHQVDGVTLPALGTCGSRRLSQGHLGYEEFPSSPPAALARPLPSRNRRSSLAQGSPGRCIQRMWHSTTCLLSSINSDNKQFSQQP